MSASRIGGAITNLKGSYINVLGGYDNNLRSQSSHYQYNVASNSWSAKTNLNLAISLHDCGCVLNSSNISEIYWFSGIYKSSSSTTYRHRTYKYNTTSNTNTLCTDFALTTTIADCLLRYSCAVLDNKIYILGGTLNDTGVQTCQVYIPY